MEHTDSVFFRYSTTLFVKSKPTSASRADFRLNRGDFLSSVASVEIACSVTGSSTTTAFLLWEDFFTGNGKSTGSVDFGAGESSVEGFFSAGAFFLWQGFFSGNVAGGFSISGLFTSTIFFLWEGFFSGNAAGRFSIPGLFSSTIFFLWEGFFSGRGKSSEPEAFDDSISSAWAFFSAAVFFLWDGFLTGNSDSSTGDFISDGIARFLTGDVLSLTAGFCSRRFNGDGRLSGKDFWPGFGFLSGTSAELLASAVSAF
jgi:hypothetical protein